MTVSDQVQSLLFRAAARATLAPSIHNTQPWRFVIDHQLELYSDPSRAVPVIDPEGRQRTISCGAALYGARIALSGAAAATELEILPDATREPELMARLTVTGLTEPADLEARRLDAAARSRRSNRRRFGDEHVPPDVVDRLQHAAQAEGALLQPVTDPDDRLRLAPLLQHADAEQSADPAYRTELRAWTSDDPSRLDGVPAEAVPHVIGRHATRDDNSVAQL